MSRHSLDRPIWGALAGRHKHHSITTGLARRYAPEISPFAATLDDSIDSQRALVQLVRDTGPVMLAQRGEVLLPRDLTFTMRRELVQMMATDVRSPDRSLNFVELTDADAAEMLALATLTRPGPFLSRTHEFGGFIGIRDNGHLVAMAGERLKPDGYSEVSGVCTHPAARGQGLAAKLSAHVAYRILQRGELPFLHSYADNATAVRLYERLGFRIRCNVTVAGMELASAPLG